jgi:hypothetical protein
MHNILVLISFVFYILFGVDFIVAVTISLPIMSGADFMTFLFNVLISFIFLIVGGLCHMIFNLQNEIYRLKAVQKSDSYK